MRLTRAKVETMLRQGTATAGDHDVRAIVRSSSGFSDEITPESVTAVYRDVKRCLFCKNRSVLMSSEVLGVTKTGAQFFDGPNQKHVRLMLYGLCGVHEALAEKDPERWTAARRRLLEEALERRIRQAARTN